ncbi:oligosaccharide flippase family protein [Oribacterium sp. NK2B42]|uniref:oligosaccharide flippase family protein n=1 Tax=Oribacterium sp. NK2B42 TaxID=689781 RepID=UPI000426E1C4|nr:oligosaccharide flippase family protein [Oribacterium sp. NK2B42]
MNKARQRKFGIVLSYLVMASNFLIGLVYTPFLIRSLGQSEYGNYNYVNSIASYLVLLTCGFGSAYLRFSSPYRKNNDKDGIENVNGLFLVLFFIMGTIALLIGGVMTIKSDWILSGKLTENELETGKLLMGILVANVFMTFPVSIFNSYIIAQERFVFQKALTLVSTFLTPVTCTIVLLLGQKVVGIAIATLCVTVIVDTVIVLYCIVKLKMRFQFHFIRWEQAKEVYIFSLFLLLSMIVDQVNWSVDKFLLGKICGTVVVAIYTVGSTINSYYMSMGEAISNVFVPKVYELLSHEDGDHQATILMTRLGRVQFMVLSLIITGFALYGKLFIYLWVGNDYALTYYVILLLIIPVTIPEIQKIGLEIQKAKNLHKFRSLVYTLIAIVNIAITIPLAHTWGAVGAALGTAITVFVGNGIIMNLYYHKKVHVDMKYFWKNILKLFPSVIGSAIIGLGINISINPYSWPTFIICVILYTTVYLIVIFFFGLYPYERNYIMSLLRRTTSK